MKSGIRSPFYHSFSFYKALCFATGISLLAACASQPQSMVSEPPPSADYLEGNGIYQVESYSDAPDVPEYGDATIYYPANKSEAFGAIAISPGFTESQDHMNWWGPRLASHGFAVLTFNTNAPRDYPELRADALMSAIGILRGENSRDGSPLFGKIDLNKMAVMGHSMGGGGALIAANNHSDKLAAAIPFTPWQRNADFSKVSIPTLIIAGETDRIAPVAEHSWPFYEMLSDSTPKAYVEFKNGNHFIGNTVRSNLDAHKQIGRYAIAWLKLYVDEDERYRSFIYGDVPERDKELLSRFEVNEGEAN